MRIHTIKNRSFVYINYYYAVINSDKTEKQQTKNIAKSSRHVHLPFPFNHPGKISLTASGSFPILPPLK